MNFDCNRKIINSSWKGWIFHMLFYIWFYLLSTCCSCFLNVIFVKVRQPGGLLNGHQIGHIGTIFRWKEVCFLQMIPAWNEESPSKSTPWCYISGLSGTIFRLQRRRYGGWLGTTSRLFHCLGSLKCQCCYADPFRVLCSIPYALCSMGF